MSDSESSTNGDANNLNEDGQISQFMQGVKTPDIFDLYRNPSHKEFSGVEDAGRAREMLSKAGWDLELAIQEALNHSEGQPSIFSPEGRENADNDENQEVELRQRRRRLQPSAPPLPSRFPQFRTTALSKEAWNTFFRRPLPVTDPVGDVRSFINSFEEKYGTTHPRFFEGGYNQALNEVKRELKFLLIYLHSPVHQDTDRFCTEVLCDPNIVAFLDANFVLWACSVRSPEGARVSRVMRETRYPFLALVCMRENFMAMVFRQEGFVDAGGLVNLLSIAMEDNNVYLAAARQQREAIQQNQQLRTEQERHFEDIQRADREREEARRETERAEAAAAQKAAEAEQAAQNYASRLSSKKAEIREKLEKEGPVEEEGADVVRVSLKFPSGTRLQRNFQASQSLEELFNVCFVHDECPADFSLVTNFPRKELRCFPQWASEFFPDSGPAEEPASFAEAGLSGAVVVFVQDNAA